MKPMAKRTRIQRPETIDLYELLNGTPTWEQVATFFRDGEFGDEHYLVSAIEKHLQTEEQRLAIFNARISIEKMLNGRTVGEDAHKLEARIYDEWNRKLGHYQFGGSLGDRHGKVYDPMNPRNLDG